MLIEMAIGDAYGAAFEFMSDNFIARENDLSGYKRNPETQLGDDARFAYRPANRTCRPFWTWRSVRLPLPTTRRAAG